MTGSTCVARIPGMTAAIVPMIAKITATAANVTPSCLALARGVATCEGIKAVRRQAERRHYSWCVELWKNADPVLRPKVDEVKKKLARL